MNHTELAAAGFEIDATAYQRLSRFVELLLRENQRLNLISARAAGQIWPAHMCDSLALVSLLRATRPRRLLDLGSGGGLPGIPLACVCPEIQVTLLDATRKKVAAVQRICAELGLANVTARWGRAETVAHDPACRESFDAVTARALAPLPMAVEYAAGFARRGGRCHFFKSCRTAEAERAAAESAARQCKLRFVEKTTYSLPAPHGDRVIVTYIKQAPLSRDLPRAPGRAAHRPL